MELKDIFKGSITIEETKLGLSNKNYIVTENGIEYMCKEYSNHVTNYELANNNLVKSFDVPTYYLDDRYKITLKLNAKPINEAKYNQENLIRVAKQIRRFHDSNIKSFNVFNPFNEYRKYLIDIVNPLVDYTQYDGLLDSIKNI
jgi:hypothetical protein